MKRQSNSPNQGMASLSLVLIVVTIISLIMIPILLFTYIRNTQAIRFYHSQQAFFAAEGAYSETIARIKAYPDWIPDDSIPHEHDYDILPNTIHRFITRTANTYYIEITADNQLAQRKIEGTFTAATTATSTYYYDLVLVMDYSSSMGESCLPGSCPIDKLKPAATNLLNIFRNVNNRVGLVIFETNVTSYDFQPATDTHIDYLNSVINGRSHGGSTALPAGVYQGQIMLNDNDVDPADDPDRKQVMILFSDGVPNKALVDHPTHIWSECATAYSPVSFKQPCACDNNECTQPASDYTFAENYYYEMSGGNPILYTPADYEPGYLEHYGSFCTKQAIQIANDVKNNSDPEKNITIYSVFLQNAPKAYCKTESNFAQPTLVPSDPSDMALAERVIKLGRLTNYFISSETDPYHYSGTTDYEYYKEASSADELYDIFSDIGETISSAGSSSYSEAVPD